MARFGDEERRIKEMFREGEEIFFGGSCYTIQECGKPTCKDGEPKTDIYIKMISNSNKSEEIKISFKKGNADFLENKISSARAEQLFGSDWANLIQRSTGNIQESFLTNPLIFKKSKGNTQCGSITLGWKFELLNKPGGYLSGLMLLNSNQVVDVYSGCNLLADKRNSLVNGRIVNNSGVANYILNNERVRSAQEVLDNIVSIPRYVNAHPNIYFACKALNYRTASGRFDGDRPLAVYIDWQVKDGKLEPKYVFNNPLKVGGNTVAYQLINCLKTLDINSIAQFNATNFKYPSLIHM